MFIKKGLRNLLIVSAITLPLLPQATPSALASDFNVENQSGKEIFYLYITKSNTGNKGKDLLKKDILKNERKRSFDLPDDSTCQYNIRAVFSNREALVEKNINLCENADVIIESQKITIKEAN